jgi:hypothetical protein
MKTNYFTIVSFALFLLLNLTSCNETTPPTEKKTKIEFIAVELTSFDFNHPNNIYEELTVTIGQDQSGGVVLLYYNTNDFIPISWIIQDGMPYHLFYGDEIITNDLENTLIVSLRGKLSDGTNETIERFFLNPSKDIAKKYTLNSSSTSPVPFSLEFMTSCE